MVDGVPSTTTTVGPTGGPDASETVAARAARGDRAAFGEIVAAHQGRVARLVSRLLGWSDDVEDVVQDVFAAALEHLPRFRGESNLGTWLATIAVNKCRSVLRRRIVRLRWRSVAAGRPGRHAHGAADSDTLRREKHQQVRRAVGRLPRRLREAE